MRLRGRQTAWVAGTLLLLAAARLPLHRATWPLPVSNDDAIPLLMARHLLGGEAATILWNQPYNGTLDAWLLAPLLAVASPHTAFRLYEALCGALLVGAAAALASRVGGTAAGLAAGALAAVGTPYMALMAATGPTPNFLVPLLVGLLAWAAMGALPPDDRAAEGARGAAAAAGWGLVAGLAIWDSALAVPALAGAAAGLAAAGWRPRAGPALGFVAGLALGLLPLALAGVVGASAASPVTDLRPRWLWLDGLSDLSRAAAGLLGLQVPLVVDGPERAPLPAPAVAALAVALPALVLAGATLRRARPLLGWGLALCAAFALSRRTGGDEVRYLFGLVLPVIALAGAGVARLAAWRPPVAALLALAVSVPWLVGHRRLLAAWRDPGHAARVWQVPPLEPVLDTLRRAGVASAYASLQFAGRLALESDGEVTASQAWNERIPGDPLRFRDEVDLDPHPAWVLHPHLSRGMPRAGGFRDLMGALGGSFHEDRPGELSVFRAFVPPWDESRPVPAEEMDVRSLDGSALPSAVRDRDPGTSWVSPRGIAPGSGVVVSVPPRRLSGLVLQVPLEPTPLGARWVCDLDGVVVAQGPLRHALQWVNGAPRAGRQALLAVRLPGTAGARVRLLFQDAGPPLGLTEVFLYGPDEGERPRAGRPAAEAAYAAARAGNWDEAARFYAEAVRAEPHRAAHHNALVRARWRASHRRWLDVESLDDGGRELVERR